MLHQAPHIPHYTIVSPLGSGTSGHVWLAKDVYGERRAIKVAHFDYVNDADYQRRFKREVTAQQQLYQVSSHVARIFDYDEKHVPPYIVMDYINGMDLNRLIATHEIAQYNLMTRLHWIEALASTLTKAHSMRIPGDQHGIIHRDIKPQNIRIQGERPYLLDFSISLTSDVEVDSTQDAMTLRYAAPEVSASEATDVFSFGIVAYEILYEIHPITTYDEASRLAITEYSQHVLEKLLKGTWRYPSRVESKFAGMNVGNIQERLDEVFKKVLALDPEERYATPKDFSDDLSSTLLGASTGPAYQVFASKMTTEIPSSDAKLTERLIEDTLQRREHFERIDAVSNTTRRFAKREIEALKPSAYDLDDQNTEPLPAIDFDNLDDTHRLEDRGEPEYEYDEDYIASLSDDDSADDAMSADKEVTTPSGAEATKIVEPPFTSSGVRTVDTPAPATPKVTEQSNTVTDEPAKSVASSGIASPSPSKPAKAKPEAKPKPTSSVTSAYTKRAGGFEPEPETIPSRDARPAEALKKFNPMYAVLLGAIVVIGLLLVGGGLGDPSAGVADVQTVQPTDVAIIAGDVTEEVADTVTPDDDDDEPTSTVSSRRATATDEADEPTATDDDDSDSNVGAVTEPRATSTRRPTSVPDTPVPTATATLTPTKTYTPTITRTPSPPTATPDIPDAWEVRDTTVRIDDTSLTVSVIYMPQGCITTVTEQSLCAENGFWIDLEPVSNQNYDLCLRTGNCSRPAFGELFDPAGAGAKNPVVGVNLTMAKQYCEWRNAELPTSILWRILMLEQPDAYQLDEWTVDPLAPEGQSQMYTFIDEQIHGIWLEGPFLDDNLTFRCIRAE